MMQLQDCKKKKKKERFQKQTNNKEGSAYPITWFRGYKKGAIDVLNSKGQRER